jgi:signal transduction histidine kinase
VTSTTDPQRLAVLVHEVRSPVAALAAIAETVRDEGLETRARLELSRLAITACLGIQRVVLDAAVASVHVGPVDIVALVRQVVATAKLAGAPVRSEIEHDLPSVIADSLRLRQALDNLVANAVKHSGSDDDVVISARSNGQMVVLEVTDFGAGVPVADHERIFETGVRLDAGRVGSGLGLSIARAIAEAHGGELTMRSAASSGATFTITLPVG